MKRLKRVPSISRVSILALSVALAACQSTSNLNNQPVETLNVSKMGTSKQAKAELENALKNQFKHAFSYQTDMRLSNAGYLQAAEHATEEQLSNAEDKNLHCKHQHDTAYIALRKKAENTDEGFYGESFANERQAIKDTYIKCKTEQDDFYQDIESYYDDLMEVYDENGDNADEVDELAEVLAPEYLPNYDSQYTQARIKKAQLINAYLFKPLSAQMTGVYQPYSGRFTAFPSVTYDAKNLFMQINQPIYLDLKSGYFYIWSNAASGMTSSLFDRKLGTKWHNKWLRLSLNDGSFPPDFNKNILKIYQKTLSQYYQNIPETEFRYLSVDEIDERSLSAYQKDMTASYVIELTGQNKRFQFYRDFYDAINQQYPEIFNDDNDNLEYSLSENTEESENTKEQEEKENGYDGDEVKDEQNGQLLYTKKLLAELLTHLYVSYSLDELLSQNDADEDNTDNKEELPSSHISVINVKNTGISKKYFGFDKEGKLKWWYYQKPLQRHTLFIKENNQYELEVFTKILPNHHHKFFPNLSDEFQIPSLKNSVDMRDYVESLRKRYQDNDEEVSLQSVLFNLIFNHKQTGDELEQNDVEDFDIDDDIEIDDEVDDTEMSDTLE